MSITTEHFPGHPPRATSTLSQEGRRAALEAMGSETELDLLVIGGGITGAGTALDAATRGLRVGLVEARDWASGTSSRSSKLVHGGLRYLEMLDFGLVREALKERGLLLQRIAPHLVRPVRFLYPLKHHLWERAYLGAGLALYDALAGFSGKGRGLPTHRHLTRAEALRQCSGLRRDALTGAVAYWDAQVDDARYTMTVVRTAAQYGALCANRTQVVGLLRDGSRVIGARLVDLESGREVEVRARQVIGAAGVWTDDLQRLATSSEERPLAPDAPHVRASKGVHLVVSADHLRSETGLILRTERSVLFVIPWGAHWIIGTTDTEWTLDKGRPAASSADIDYILDRVNAVLTKPIQRSDIQGVYVGLRPLVSGEGDSTVKLSREHVVAQPAPGLVTIAGGKFTTYRIMARDAVDVACRAWGESVPPSCTQQVPLVGASEFLALWNSRIGMAEAHGLALTCLERLLQRYGSDVTTLLELIDRDPTLGREVENSGGYLRAEIQYAASHEGALHLDDVLTRRTRISMEVADRGTGCAREVAEILASVLDWEPQRIEAEVETYRNRVAAELESQRQPDDVSAAEARLAVRESVPVR